MISWVRLWWLRRNHLRTDGLHALPGMLLNRSDRLQKGKDSSCFLGEALRLLRNSSIPSFRNSDRPLYYLTTMQSSWWDLMGYLVCVAWPVGRRARLGHTLFRSLRRWPASGRLPRDCSSPPVGWRGLSSVVSIYFWTLIARVEQDRFPLPSAGLSQVEFSRKFSNALPRERSASFDRIVVPPSLVYSTLQSSQFSSLPDTCMLSASC